MANSVVIKSVDVDAAIDLNEGRDLSRFSNPKTLGLFTAIGFLLRLYKLNSQSFWLDEGASIRYVQEHHGPLSIISSLVHGGDNHPPLHFLVLDAMQALFSATNEIAMRMPSVIASTLLIPAAWMISSTIAPRSRVVAVALTAFSPFLIWYGQEARMYAMAEAFAAWSFVAYFKTLQSDSVGSRNKWLALHVVTRVCGFYTHIYALLLNVAELVALSRAEKQRRKPLLVAMAIEFAFILPWLAVLYNVRNNAAGIETSSPLVSGAYSIFAFVFGYSLGPSVRQLHEHASISSFELVQLIAAGLVSCGLAYLIWKLRLRNQAQQLAIIVVTPVLLAGGITEISSVSLNARYISIVTIPFICLVTWALHENWNAQTTRACAIGLGALTVLSLTQYWTVNKYQRDDYRSAVHFIVKNGPNDPLYALTYPAPIDVYAPSDMKLISLAPDSQGSLNWQKLQSGGLTNNSFWILEAREWELPDSDQRLHTLLGSGKITQQAQYAGVKVLHVSNP